MRILLTGVGGNVGKYLAKELSKCHDVIGVYRSRIPCDIDCKLIQADLSKTVLNMSGIDVVLHAAAGLEGTTESLVKDNIHSVENLIMAAQYSRVKKFVYFSTVSVYGNARGVLTEESERVNPGVYGVTKFLAEELVLESEIEQKMVIELPRMLGPFVDLYTKNSGFIMMARKLICNEDIDCYIPEVEYNNFMHVSDLERFVEKLLQQEKWCNPKVVLGARDKLPMMKILEIMKNAINSKSMLNSRTNDTVPACSVIDISHALEMGYDPMKSERVLIDFMNDIGK